jgi:hypothetical protein
MNSEEKTTESLEDVKVNVKIKLSALWAMLLLIYIYVDIFSFYKPGIIEDILAGKVWEFEISQGWALGSLILMIVPILMVFIALALPAKANRWTNIIVSILYIVVGIGTTVGESWAYYIVGHAVGIALLLLIVWYAWKWPKVVEAQ